MAKTAARFVGNALQTVGRALSRTGEVIKQNAHRILEKGTLTNIGKRVRSIFSELKEHFRSLVQNAALQIEADIQAFIREIEDILSDIKSSENIETEESIELEEEFK